MGFYGRLYGGGMNFPAGNVLEKQRTLLLLCSNSTSKRNRFRREFDTPCLYRAANEPVTIFAGRVKQRSKQTEEIEMKQWEKELHGRYPKRIWEADVDDDKTNQWLKSTGLKAETEGLIIATQAQSLPTKSYVTISVKYDTSPPCKICNKQKVIACNIWMSRTCKNRLPREAQ